MTKTRITIKIPQVFKKVFYNNKKFTVLAAGRQTGKTYNAAIWIFLNLLQNPGSSGLWIDTTQTNLQKYVERYFFKIFKDIYNNVLTYNKVEKTFKFFNGSFLDFRSAERPENLEGFNYDYIVLNEAGIILKNSSLWYNSIYPMTKNAIVKIIGTPKGKNLFFKLYYMDSKDWISYKIPATESPYWSKEKIELARKQMPPQAFQQEILSEFLDDASTVFIGYKKAAQNYTIPINPQPDKKYYIGIDIAKFEDFTAIAVLEEKGKLVYLEKFNKLDYTFQKQKILNIIKTYNNATTCIDATGTGSAIYDDLKRLLGDKIIPYYFNTTSKKELIENLIIAFQNCSIIIPNEHNDLHQELELFSYKITSSGNIIYSAPQGYHDDIVMALGLAYFLIKQETPQIDLSFLDF